MKILSIALAIICSVMVPVSGFMALFAPMAMDAPDSGKSVGKWVFVLSLMASPFVFFGAAYVSWSRIAVRDYSTATWWCLAGLIPFAVAMVTLHFNWFEK